MGKWSWDILVHTPAPSLASSSQAGALAASQSSTLPSSRPGTPPRDAGTPAAAGTHTPNGGGNSGSVNKDGTVFLDCVGCGRPVRCDFFFSFPPHPAPLACLASAVVDESSIFLGG